MKPVPEIPRMCPYQTKRENADISLIKEMVDISILLVASCLRQSAFPDVGLFCLKCGTLNSLLKVVC